MPSTERTFAELSTRTATFSTSSRNFPLFLDGDELPIEFAPEWGVGRDVDVTPRVLYQVFTNEEVVEIGTTGLLLENGGEGTFYVCEECDDHFDVDPDPL